MSDQQEDTRTANQYRIREEAGAKLKALNEKVRKIGERMRQFGGQLADDPLKVDPSTMFHGESYEGLLKLIQEIRDTHDTWSEAEKYLHQYGKGN
jgi:hypothetical protein